MWRPGRRGLSASRARVRTSWRPRSPARWLGGGSRWQPWMRVQWSSGSTAAWWVSIRERLRWEAYSMRRMDDLAEPETLRGRDLVVFSNDWDGDPLSKTHIMRILARHN